MSKPTGPGVTRTNLMLVWHAGQSGRLIMMLSPLVQAGALRNSQSPADTRSVMCPHPWSILLTFEKLMYWPKAWQRRPPTQRPCDRNNAVRKNLANRRLPMPRYFFDVKDGHRLFDASGFVCEDDPDAIQVTH